MKVILLQDVKNLGVRGEEKQVSEGYAWNFLIPKGFAIGADDPKAKTIVEDIKKSKKQSEKSASNQKSFAVKLQNKTIELTRPATDSGSLYAAINPQEIAEKARKKLHLALDPARIKIKVPIKRVGEHDIVYQVGYTKFAFRAIIHPESESPNSKKY